MRLTSKTIALLVLALGLLGLNFLDLGAVDPAANALPSLSALDRDATTRIEISSAIEKVVLANEPVEGSTPPTRQWRVVAPVDQVADQVQVGHILTAFRKEVPLDAQVDTGNEDQYGLDATNGIVFEAWAGGDEPAVSITIGFDGPGGTSFVRLSGSDAVYRARIGGRARYDRPATEWRNKVLLDLRPDQIAGIEVERDGVETLALSRAPGAAPDAPGQWALHPDPGWPIDQAALEALATRLGAMRAGEVLAPTFDGGLETPAAIARVRTTAGATRELRIGSRGGDGAAFVQVDGGKDVFRVAASNVGGLLADPDDLRDRTVFAFSRADVDTYSFEAGATSIVLQQDHASNLWSVVQPRNFDIDIKLVFFSINNLAELRADALLEQGPAEAGLDPPRARLVVRFLDGRTEALELGGTTTDERGRTLVLARRQGSGQVIGLREATVQRLLQGFGR
jgi:hypothetical protein